MSLRPESTFWRRSSAPLGTALLLGGILLQGAVASDWPCWRVPTRDGKSSEKGIGTSVKPLWSVKVGQGYSAVTVSKGRVYTMGNDGSNDTVWCLNESNGKVVWKYSYPCTKGGDGHTGPRASPTVDGSTVYTMSRTGIVTALSTSGKKIWSKDVPKEVGAALPQWHLASSPVVSGSSLILNIGKAGVALNKKSGKVVWKTGKDASGYASAVFATSGGKKILAMFGAKALYGVDPASGKILWSHPWETKYDVNAADPVVSQSNVFISSNYKSGCALLSLSSSKPSVRWQNKSICNHFNSCVLVGDCLYGNDENDLVCLALSNGAEKWREKRALGKGGLVYADGKLICLSDRGELFFVKASSSGYSELRRGKAVSGQVWTPPVLANGKVYCRSHEGDLACVRVK